MSVAPRIEITDSADDSVAFDSNPTVGLDFTVDSMPDDDVVAAIQPHDDTPTIWLTETDVERIALWCMFILARDHVSSD